MRVAFVHYWLVGMRGGEKVLEDFCLLYPDADIFTHVHLPSKTSAGINRHRIATTFIGRLPFAAKLYQRYLPLMPFALEALDLTGYDLVVSFEAGPTKGVITHPDAVHVCYCHSPMRYLWDQYASYRRRSGGLTRLMMSLVMPALRVWDVAAAARVDHFVANSSFIARRIRKFYRRESAVIFPPVDLAAFAPVAHPSRDFFFCIGQLVPYKRVDLAVAVCTKLGLRLVVGGSGPEEARLRAMAGPTIEFRSWISHDELKSLYANCRAVLFPGEEDFGIVPLEAMASGRPVIAFGSGGALDTVVPERTGLFFAKQDEEHLAEALARFELLRFDPQVLRDHAAGFSREAFRARMRAFLNGVVAKREPEPLPYAEAAE